MAENAPPNIPYERQSDPASSRTCGAAALCMVYRSLGMRASQAELAARLASSGPASSTGVRTYLLAQDALASGVSAVVLRAKDPLATLKECHKRRLRVILNHRPKPESRSGHFTVLVDLVGEDVVVHDPLAGPNTRIRQKDLLELWQPPGGSSEITGNVLVVLAKDGEPAAPCGKCGTPIPESRSCPACGQPIALGPVSVLGCMSATCPERAWDALFCPHCDFVLRATPTDDPRSARGAKPVSAGTEDGKAPEGIDEDPMKIGIANQEIDKFLAVVMSVNSSRPVPNAAVFIASLRECQAQLKALQAEHAAEARAKAAQPPPAPRAAPATPPAAPPRAEPPPRPPVDWNELGRKLVQEIGLHPR